ncbi:MAG: radical SAM protein [Thermoplasmata archaeon]|nr:radical SAM protein [Euryarchaeota archaeon]RLF66340.1 MAG: radical SAM protein [Thermoplasmata archaeon]
MKRIRVSIGTAAKLGLVDIRVDAPMYTGYLMTPHACNASCAYCAQGFGVKSRLSRVVWPEFDFDTILKALKEKNCFKRICLQVTYNIEAHRAMISYTRILSGLSSVSVSFYPMNHYEIQLVKEAGADYIGISLDVASRELFKKYREYETITWENTFDMLKYAVKVFGKGHVISHVIVGLGETDKDLIRVLEKMSDLGVVPSLMAFTPVPGTPLENYSPPSIERYRAIQVALELITHGIRFHYDNFDEKGRLVSYPLDEGTIGRIIGNKTFMVKGCPWCTRPYYNENPSRPYNLPRPIGDPKSLLSEAIKYVKSDS